MFRRAENVSKTDLLYQVVHLLTGKARAWYQNIYFELNTWDEFVCEIKRKFLPNNYNFSLLAEIENRKQSRNESVGNYINDMELKFRAMPMPISTEHKLYIIQKNLLPHHVYALASLDVRTVSELEDICKRMESARSMMQTRNTNDPWRVDKENNKAYTIY